MKFNQLNNHELFHVAIVSNWINIERMIHSRMSASINIEFLKGDLLII